MSDAAGSPHHDSLRSSLLGRLRSGDEGAWRDLVELYGPLVYGWCRRAGLAPEDARDAGQDVFQAIAAGLPRFRHDRPDATFRGWVWTIMRNKVRDFQRKPVARAVGGSDAHARLARLPEPADQDACLAENDAPSASEIADLARRAVDRVRGEFEPRTWQAFWRATVEDQPTTEVAAALGMTANAVRVARCKVLRRLRDELGETSP